MTCFLTHAIMKQNAEVKEMGLFDRLFKKREKQNYRPLIIYGLCGPVGLGAHKSGEAQYWRASIILRAWKEEGSDVLHEEKIRLEKSCDEEGVHVLQAQLRKNAIFHAKVRISEQGFELLELIENDCSEPQLEALRGAAAPQADVRMSEEEEAEVAEGRCRIQTFAKARTKVYFEGKQEEGIRILHAMQKRQVGWYNDAVNYAADRAVPKFNAALPNGEKKLTKKAFREQVRLQKIVISDNERFVFWLDATDLVKDAVIGVSGSLQALREELGEHAQVICMDLRDEKSCRMLYERVRAEEIDILINNAGFGLCGPFDETSLDRELEMIDLNIRAVHILTKLFLRDFIERDYGYILNVSSIAAYAPGPLMATYYASKAYVLRLSQSIYGELRRRGSHVHVAALCPGPVRTEFNQVAGVEFFTSGMSAQKAAKIAIDGMFSEKREIIPGAMMKWVRALTRVAPTALQLRVSHYLQHRKTEK